MYIDTIHKHIINAVVKDDRGETVAYRIEDGEIVVKEQAVNMAKHGFINGVAISKSKNGEEYLEINTSTGRINNVQSLPIINENELK